MDASCAKPAESPTVWAWESSEGGWNVALGGSCCGYFSSLSDCCLHVYLLAGVFSAGKTEVCGKHLLIQSEDGDGNWGTRVTFSFMAFAESQYLLWIKASWQLCAEGQQVRKHGGSSNFLPFHPPKSTGSALYKHSVSAFQGRFYDKINKDMTFTADLSLMYLSRWEAQGNLLCLVFPSCFILLSSAAGSQCATCQGRETQSQPVQGKVHTSSCMGLL